MMYKNKEAILKAVNKFYGGYKEREVEKILSRTDYQDEVQEYLRGKANIDVIDASELSSNQSSRCVAFLVSHPCNRIIKFFLSNPDYKPWGLTSTVQLAYLCETDWQDNIYKVVDILETARTTKVKDRKEIMNHAGYFDGTATFIEYLLNKELNLSLFKTKSKYYQGNHIKKVAVYDSAATA